MRDLNHNLLDQHFALFLTTRCGLSQEQKPHFQALVQDLSASLTGGHSCLHVDNNEAQLLIGSSLVSLSGNTPLILFDNKLYLHRYYHYERLLAQRVNEMSGQRHRINDCENLLNHYFGSVDTEEMDMQRVSASVALEHGLSIISGGPGTGKTSTVVKIIALLVKIYGSDLKVVPAAPTGKAAMRLGQSIEGNRNKYLSSDVWEGIISEAMTLHRLLGVKRYSPVFRHHQGNPLDYNVVIIDEASMVDLAMMAKLVDALRPKTRLILLGDKDQLASVESGSVLADLISALPENTTTLTKSYRFNKTIQQLANHINEGEGEAAWMLLSAREYENILLSPYSFIESIGKRYEQYMEQAGRFKGGEQYGELLKLFTSFQVLCAVRRGGYGVEMINKKVERYLSNKGYECLNGEFYPGRPVMITQNDYSLDLYNGDVGICLIDTNGEMRVWFERPDGTVSGYHPHRLPQCETVFAMSIHKSQGSEFNEVLVVLPREQNRILSRELMYTAVTRAKERVIIMAEKEIFTLSIERRVVRDSGLKKMLEEINATS